MSDRQWDLHLAGLSQGKRLIVPDSPVAAAVAQDSLARFAQVFSTVEQDAPTCAHSFRPGTRSQVIQITRADDSPPGGRDPRVVQVGKPENHQVKMRSAPLLRLQLPDHSEGPALAFQGVPECTQVPLPRGRIWVECAWISESDKDALGITLEVSNLIE